MIYGFVKVPINDKIKFTLITSGAVEMTVNGESIIKHFSTDYKFGWKGAAYGDKVTSEEV